MLTMLLLAASAATADSVPPHVDVRRDDHRHELIVTIGPFNIPASMPMLDMDMMTMHQDEALLGRFVWPSTASFHAVRLSVATENGTALPRRLLHHTYMVNFDRRQLVFPIAERPFSFGEETEDLKAPATIGVPMVGGQRLGIVIMWNNETGREINGAYVRYAFRLNPQHQRPAPMAVLPIFVDIGYHAGGGDVFVVPPGGRTLTREFEVPVSGRLIGASGHLHDHAVEMRVEDVQSGANLVTVHAVRDSTGRVERVSRELPGLWGRGPHLVAGRPYRLVLVYDNPTRDTLTGVMGMLGGLFTPDRLSDWPAIDSTNAEYLADLRGLLSSEPRPLAVTH
jgi:hypothetical protein